MCCINNEINVPDLPQNIEVAIGAVNGVTNLHNENFNSNNEARRNLINNYFKKLL